MERPIGIFDSGIGGVTVLKEIIKILPNEEYIYYSDSANNPYGDKQDKEIISGCCYTQLYDVEQEQNGLYTYDRRVKLSATALRRIAECNSRIAAIEKTSK